MEASAERATSGHQTLLDEALRAPFLERGTLGHDQGELGELRGEEKTRRVAECVALSANIDVAEERERLDFAVLVHRILSHVHIALADSLALDTAEMDSLLFGVIFHDFDDGEAVDCSEMSIGGVLRASAHPLAS